MHIAKLQTVTLSIGRNSVTVCSFAMFYSVSRCYVRIFWHQIQRWRCLHLLL